MGGLCKSQKKYRASTYCYEKISSRTNAHEVAPSLPDLTVITDLNFYDPFLWIYRNPEKGFYEHLSKAT
jgi:hypothetical protein